MKAILEFNLPEDNGDHNICVKAFAMYATLREMDEWLRGKIKYGHEYKTIDEALVAVRDELRELLTSNAIDLENLNQ